MLQRLSSAARLAPLLALLLLGTRAHAEPSAVAPPPAAPEVRRDPLGVKGISPFTEALMRGDAALLARDLDAATLAYRDAISKQPENALGHYRVGEVQVMKGNLHEAEAAFSAGLRLVNAASLGLKAKLEFALADLRERQMAYDEALKQWAEYEASTRATADGHGFPASARERKKVIEAWQKLSADSLAVKGRIEKGVKAADEAVKKSSK